MAFAPDKNSPFPRRVTNGNGNGNGGKNGGGSDGNANFAPGQVNDFVNEMVAMKGGDPDKWRAYYKALYAPVQKPDYSWEKGGGNGGGKNGGGGDPTTPGTPGKPGDGGFTPTYPGHSMAPVGSMPQGFLNPIAGQQMAPTLGLLNRPPMANSQSQLPPEIQALLMQRR